MLLLWLLKLLWLWLQLELELEHLLLWLWLLLLLSSHGAALSNDHPLLRCERGRHERCWWT